MKLLTFILGCALFSSSFALLEGYTPITDRNQIGEYVEVLTQGIKTSLLLARNDPTSIISPKTYKIWTLHEFGYQEGELGMFYQMIADVVENADTSVLIATVNCVIFQDAEDGSFVFLSYKVTPPGGDLGGDLEDVTEIPDDDLNMFP